MHRTYKHLLCFWLLVMACGFAEIPVWAHGPGSESLGKALVTARAVCVGTFRVKDEKVYFVPSEILRGKMKKTPYPVRNRSIKAGKKSQIICGRLPGSKQTQIRISTGVSYLVPILSATGKGVVIASSRYDRNNRGYSPFLIGKGTMGLPYLKGYRLEGEKKLKYFLSFIEKVEKPTDLIPFMKKSISNKLLCLEILVGTEFFHNRWKRHGKTLYRYRYQAEAVLLDVVRPKGKRALSPFYLNDYLDFVKKELRIPILLKTDIFLTTLKRWLEKKKDGYRPGGIFSNNLLASLNGYGQLISDRMARWKPNHNREAPILKLGAGRQLVKKQLKKLRSYVEKYAKYTMFEPDFPEPETPYEDGLHRWVQLTAVSDSSLSGTAKNILERISGFSSGSLSIPEKQEKETWKQWSGRTNEVLFSENKK